MENPDASRLLGIALLTLALSACAAYRPVPEGYIGPVAIVGDTGNQEDGTRARIFAMVEVDGQRIENSFGATASANQGRGFSLTTVHIARRVPIRQMKVRLRGSHVTGAPIHAMFSQMAGTFHSVEGETEFLPEAGERYIVRGELNKEGSSIWIENAATNQAVTDIVRSRTK